MAAGAKWLRGTQKEDGTWYVKSRAPKFQPYFESGFPYGHDQWISSAATAWVRVANEDFSVPVVPVTFNWP